MKFYSERARFEGVIDNKCVKDLANMDFSKSSVEDRKKHVNKILNECDSFINGYINNYYKVCTTNELSDDINVFKNLEMLATYLLDSKDLPSESTQEYKIFTDEELFKKATKENKEDYDNVMLFLKKNKRNEYIVKPLGIESKDFEDDRIKDYLISYSIMYDYLKNQLSLARKGEKIQIKNIKLAKKMSREIKDDMILIKDKLVRPIKLNIKGGFSHKSNWETFDYTNINHVKAMLYINRSGIIPEDDLSLIKYDFDCAIKHLFKSGKLDKKDMFIINLIKKDKSYTYEDIGKELQMSKQAVYGRINRIAKALVKYFSKKFS